ncbi:hypothetical protein KM043_003497 [Ampulex compressa]|nr:hypothetical protein KM043_003497 [Ampulex compressa]
MKKGGSSEGRGGHSSGLLRVGRGRGLSARGVGERRRSVLYRPRVKVGKPGFFPPLGEGFGEESGRFVRSEAEGSYRKRAPNSGLLLFDKRTDSSSQAWPREVGEEIRKSSRSRCEEAVSASEPQEHRSSIPDSRKSPRVLEPLIISASSRESSNETTKESSPRAIETKEPPRRTTNLRSGDHHHQHRHRLSKSPGGGFRSQKSLLEERRRKKVERLDGVLISNTNAAGRDFQTGDSPSRQRRGRKRGKRRRAFEETPRGLLISATRLRWRRCSLDTVPTVRAALLIEDLADRRKRASNREDRLKGREGQSQQFQGTILGVSSATVIECIQRSLDTIPPYQPHNPQKGTTNSRSQKSDKNLDTQTRIIPKSQNQPPREVHL